MLGAIIGDIVGSVYEAHSHRSKLFEPLFHPDASFTDGTVCTIAVADALINDRHPGVALKDWGRRYWNNGGWGQRFAMWLASDTLEPYGSFGNGAAMRVSHPARDQRALRLRPRSHARRHPAGLALQPALPGDRAAGAGLRAHRNELRGRDPQRDLDRR